MEPVSGDIAFFQWEMKWYKHKNRKGSNDNNGEEKELISFESLRSSPHLRGWSDMNL